jgi:hypothetical protein
MLARSFVAIMMLMIAASAFAVDSADDSDWGHVGVTILPTVRVTYLGGDIHVGEVTALDQICAQLLFEVHANGQEIAMMAGGSVLYKDDNPNSSFQIPVDQLTEVVITAAYGEYHSLLPDMSMLFPLGMFGEVMVYHTDWMYFGSGDAGTWSYEVYVDICWQGDDAELFQGEYSGGVVLWSMYVAI